MTIAYYCVLAAGLLPILSAALTKAGNFGPKDNHAARAHAEAQTGWRKRAYWSQQNGWEAFPLFAAAVIIASVRGADSSLVDTLAMTFIGARVLYIGLYVADKATLRSVTWSVGLGSSIALFFI